MKYRREPDTSDAAGLPRRKKRGLGVIPTLFTLGNLLCGFASVHYASRGTEKLAFITYFALAGYLIFAAMLFDMLDGFMARLTKSTSDFGAELDSLADMVSFGIAPAYLTLCLIGYLVREQPNGPLVFPGPLSDNVWMRLFWGIGALYVCCTALRLARFNVMNKHEVDSHMNFRGLPSPGAAAVVASTVVFFEALYADNHILPFPVSRPVVDMLRSILPYLMPPLLLAAALLMVSRFAYAHLINRFLRGRRRFNYIVRIVLVVLLVLWQPQITALLAIYIYALSAPAAWLYRVAFGHPAPVPTIGSPPEAK